MSRACWSVRVLCGAHTASATRQVHNSFQKETMHDLETSPNNEHILHLPPKHGHSSSRKDTQVLFDALQTITTVLGAVVLISIANPTIIPVFLPLAWTFLRVRSYYLSSSRETKRLEAVTRSPVYASFSATIKGMPTIRAYGIAPRFRRDFLAMLNLNGSWWMAYLACARCARTLLGLAGRV
jgi:ABC-type multidrug transport system fused ATPase/permease subunit